MEFIAGHPFRMALDRSAAQGEQLPLDVVVKVMGDVCKGLDYAHERKDPSGRPLNIVHRDVSPQNVMISFGGEVKLIDFGIAKAAGKITRTRAGSIKGKFGYMSPEQVRGLPLDRRSDVFSLGICLWEALTCERLYDGANELLVLEQIRSAPIVPPSERNPAVPKELDRIVLKALAKGVEERYGTASALDADLQNFAQSSGISGDAGRVAGFMQRMFPADAASSAAAHHKKRDDMSDKGSDLDVFDGLTAKKKSQRPPAPMPPGAPGPRPGPPRQKTLLGLAAPVPPPPSRGPGLPPPTSSKPGAPPPPAPPSRRSAAPPPPPSRASGAPRPPMPSKPGPPMPTPPRSSGPPPSPPALSKPPIPPSSGKAPPPAPAPVEMDWDDEDEKTAIYDKAQNEDAARALLRSAPPPPAAGAPAPPAPAPAAGAAALAASGSAPAAPPSFPKPPAVPRSTPPPPPQQPVQSVAPQPAPMPPPQAMPASIPPPAPAGRTALIAVAALLGVVLIAAVALLLLPRKGSMLITVAGPGGKPLDKVEVFVDGVRKCETSPCRVTDLSSGSHMVNATASGYQGTAPQGVSVESGSEAVLNLTLGVATEGTGIKVNAEGATGLRLWVNDKDKGPLPQELKDMKPGEYTVKVAGNDAFETYQKKITVKPDELQKLDLKLKVKKGLAEIKRGQGADGAEVYLVTGNERRRLTNKLPIKLSISTDKPYKIVAKKKGFSDYRKDVTFEDNKAEKAFVITMVEFGKAPPKPAGGGVPAPGPRPIAGGGRPPAPAPAPAPAGQGTVNVNSIPVSSVILNGRPLGTTPKTGIKVEAGPVTAVFVHPEHGRKVRSTVVKPGGTATLVVRFP